MTALDEGKSVVVCAPTGSGKTLIGEYGIYRALAQGKRAFYTTPLKALSNQKFRDFLDRFSQPPWDFLGENPAGLITGDTIINAGAPIVVMTTEIFRNMLYETPIGQVGTSLESVGMVVLDECHYISDRGRGTVWEESIIYCPAHIQMVALSATIGNPEMFTNWVNHTRLLAHQDHPETEVRRCELIDSDHRPVPLRFFFSTKKGLFPLLNEEGTGMNPRLKPPKTHLPNDRKHRQKRTDVPWLREVVAQLQDQDLLPAIYVIFSRRGCEQALGQLAGLTLTQPAETLAIVEALMALFFLPNPELQHQLLGYLQAGDPLMDRFMDVFRHDPNQLDETAYRESICQLWDYCQGDDNARDFFLGFLDTHGQIVNRDQLDSLLRGIATHHAGGLPAWKELVEMLFERGLVKLVFATATLSAGLNMPARTTVISALKKRSDDGHRFLTPSEFLQIAGRAGRRGKDPVGYVVTVQTPYEGAREAAHLATSAPENLQSCFTPSYGMVLNLLQKHSLEETKELLTRSFAEYLIQEQLTPEQEAIAELTTALARLDVELAGVDDRQLEQFRKLRERLKEEQRLGDLLLQQAEGERKKLIAPLLLDLAPGALLYLKGKHIRVGDPVGAILIEKVNGSGQAPYFLCLTAKNQWIIVGTGDVHDYTGQHFPVDRLPPLTPPELLPRLGQKRKGDESSAQAIAQWLPTLEPITPAPEVLEQQARITALESQLSSDPLSQKRDPQSLLARFQQRQELRQELYRRQNLYQQHSSKRSYYWQDFLSLIQVLQYFGALEGHTPTLLGEVAATLRGENELWLALALLSGRLEDLDPPQLAAALSALITEPPRPDSWTEHLPSREVLIALGIQRSLDAEEQTSQISLGEVRRQLNQCQRQYLVTVPAWFEGKFLGVVEAWCRGTRWPELCDRTSQDEGDIVRLLRRTMDLLWQIPQVPGLSDELKQKAKIAIALMKRFPI